jgi:hypothetical protein
MPRVGSKPTTLVLEWAKMVHGLDPAATVIGFSFLSFKHFAERRCFRFALPTRF